MGNVVFNRFSNPSRQQSIGYNPMQQMFAQPIRQKPMPSMQNTQQSNPQAISQITERINGIKEIYKTVHGAADPVALINGMMEKNSVMRDTLSLIRQNNGDAQAAFYAKAKEMGIDPEQILSILR